MEYGILFLKIGNATIKEFSKLSNFCNTINNILRFNNFEKSGESDKYGEIEVTKSGNSKCVTFFCLY